MALPAVTLLPVAVVDDRAARLQVTDLPVAIPLPAVVAVVDGKGVLRVAMDLPADTHPRAVGEGAEDLVVILRPVGVPVPEPPAVAEQVQVPVVAHRTHKASTWSLLGGTTSRKKTPKVV